MVIQNTGNAVINTNIESLYAVHPKQVIYFSWHFIINNNTVADPGGFKVSTETLLKLIIEQSDQDCLIGQSGRKCYNYNSFIRNNWYLHKNSQTLKRGAAHAKKDSMKKVVKSKVTAQKWLWW